jgi:hypothetical protein
MPAKPKPRKPSTVEEYVAALPPDRREAIQAVRETVNRNLPKGYEEGIQYGMIGWYVPHSIYPAGYHCDPSVALPFAGLASQKNHMSFHVMSVYGSSKERAWFEAAWAKTGKRLDMGAACVRFRRLEDVALDVLGQAVARTPVAEWVRVYEGLRATTKSGRADAKRAAKKAAAKAKPAGRQRRRR